MRAAKVLTPAQLRLRDAARTAEWREAHRHVPTPREIDRVLVEALLVVIRDITITPSPLVKPLLNGIVDAASSGFERMGYQSSDAKPAIAKRINTHLSMSQASCVKAAMAEKNAGISVFREHGRRKT